VSNPAPTVPCAWWHTPPATVTPFDAVRITVECLEDGKPVPPTAAGIMARALRLYLDGKSDITDNLGLRPRRGGRHETPVAIERKARRDDGIKQLFELQQGCKTERAQKVADLLKTPPPDGRVTEAEVFGYLMQLHEEFGGGLPTSMRQVLRVVDGK
jgi:hypothetical protein